MTVFIKREIYHLWGEGKTKKKGEKHMKAVLAPSWILTTDHAASSYGQPVLVNRGTGEAYGPGDIIKPYPSFDLAPAAYAVRRLAKIAQLDKAGRELVNKFCRG